MDAADGVKGGRLAAPGRAQEGDHLAVADGQVHVLDDADRTEGLAELVQSDFHQPLVPPP